MSTDHYQSATRPLDRTLTRRTILGVLAATSVVGLASCGGDSDDDPSAAGAESAGGDRLDTEAGSGLLELGERYRELFPEEDDASTLTAALGLADDGTLVADSFPRFIDRVAEDFAEGQTVLVLSLIHI